jgi:predicted lipid-binding transport protein (Tim44 family)
MNTDKTKTEREKIEEKLHSGMTPKQVIAQGHARSTVYQVAQRALIPDTSEIAELREKKAILKLKADIEEIESKREKLPERIARLERQISALAKALDEDYISTRIMLQMARDDDISQLSDEELKDLGNLIEKEYTFEPPFLETIKKA